MTRDAVDATMSTVPRRTSSRPNTAASDQNASIGRANDQIVPPTDRIPSTTCAHRPRGTDVGDEELVRACEEEQHPEERADRHQRGRVEPQGQERDRQPRDAGDDEPPPVAGDPADYFTAAQLSTVSSSMKNPLRRASGGDTFEAVDERAVVPERRGAPKPGVSHRSPPR
jgi:hypothetical protein